MENDNEYEYEDNDMDFWGSPQEFKVNWLGTKEDFERYL